MAEKASEKFQFSKGSCTSKISGHKPLKVVHIQNPTMVKTTAPEFRAVVQYHTGRRKRSATDHDENTKIKKPKLEDRSKCNFIPRGAEPEIPQMCNDRNSTHDDCERNSQELKEVEAQSAEISDFLNFQIFDKLDSIGDRFFSGQLSPYPFYDDCN